MRAILDKIFCYKISTKKVDNWIQQGNWFRIWLALKSSNKYKERKLILERCIILNYSHKILRRNLIYIMKNDFIVVSKLAFLLFIKNASGLSEAQKRKANAVIKKYNQRLTSHENLQLYFKKCKSISGKSYHLDKSKMKMLEKVRMQLSKPIWFTP